MKHHLQSRVRLMRGRNGLPLPRHGLRVLHKLNTIESYLGVIGDMLHGACNDVFGLAEFHVLSRGNGHVRLAGRPIPRAVAVQSHAAINLPIASFVPADLADEIIVVGRAVQVERPLQRIRCSLVQRELRAAKG